MKKILILIFGILIAFTAAAQPFAEIRLRKHQFNNDVITTVDSIYRFWNNRKDVQATPGTSYQYILMDDTARYFKPPVGKKVRAKITFEDADGTTPPVDIIDSTTVDSESGTIYSTTWLHGSTTAAGWYNNTISYATVAGATASYTFIGRQVKIYAERMSSHGTGTVSILKGTQVIVNEAPVTFKSTVKQLPVLVYTSPVLADDTYTVRLKATGGAPTMLDYWRIFKKR